MPWRFHFLSGLAGLLMGCGVLHAEPSLNERIREITTWLPAEPSAAGAPISDRVAWDQLILHFPELLPTADEILKQKTPALTDALYLTFSRTGSRGEYESPYRERLHRLTVLTLAEGASNQGKYLPAIEAELNAILEEKTWTLPAFDRSLANFRGEIRDVDLGVAMRGATIATLLSWMGDKLPPELARKAAAELRARLFEPYLQKVHSPESKLCYWTNVSNNWNAVCHAAIVIAALAILPDRQERAEILANAEKSVNKYLAGFTPDGFCAEGMVYWNYGFGHYAVLAENALRSTGGKVDLYQPEIVGRVAAFPYNLELAPELYPALADAPLNPQPSDWLKALTKARLFSGEPRGGAGDVVAQNLNEILLYEAAVCAFPLVPRGTADIRELKLDPLRGWFPDAGLLVSRCVPESLSAAIVGGDNGSNHNHNDVGQFLVGFRGGLPVIDPGGERYTAASSGPRRYESGLLNSFGHSVPVVAGQLQSIGTKAAARVLSSNFSEKEDTLVMDIASAYQVDSLRKLERTFAFSRENGGLLKLRDHFEFSQPEKFESALVTYGTVDLVSEDVLRIKEGKGVADVHIDTGGLPFEIVQEKVKCSKSTPPLHVGVRLKGAFTQGDITLSITPAAQP